ncbi:hypothetical protein ACFX1X_021051 [Malus domestica]
MFTKLNVDASWDVTSAEGCVGIVARCTDGRFVGVWKLMISAPCVVVAEALAIFWETYPTLTRILRLQDSFQMCRWYWVSRSVNLTANRLASRSNTEMCGYTWINHPPYSLVHILNKDGLPCPP